MSPRRAAPTLRTGIRRAAEEAATDVNEYERALILGQIASLLAQHRKIAGRIAFKGGAIMTLVDGSPRLSKDLDGVLASGGPVSRDTVKEALLGTKEARKVVKRIDDFARVRGGGIRFPVVVCKPLSGIGEVTVQLSIKWSEPLLRDPEPEKVTIAGREVELPVMARPERAAEKVRAFLDRGEDRDAFDLYHYSLKRFAASDWSQLKELIGQKMAVHPNPPIGDLRALFDEHLTKLETAWATRGGLTLMEATPAWTEVEPHVLKFRRYLPK